MYRRMLVAAGFHVIAVEDGLDALRMIDVGGMPNVIVLDLNLPRIDGRDVYKELQSRPLTKTIPVVVVTGSDISEPDAAAFRYLLRKPIHAEALLYTIENALRSHLGLKT